MVKAIPETVYSEYEVFRLHMIFPALAEADQPEVGTIKCVGSMEETCDVRKLVKKCRGVDAKVRTVGAGTGTLKLTLHMPWALYIKTLAMDADKDLVDGVHAYGRKSIHPEFATTAHVKDEDGIEKYKAYPRATVTTGPARKVENGAEEVAEIDLEMALMPDDYDNCMYEALVADLDEATKTAWLKEFTAELVHIKEV